MNHSRHCGENPLDREAVTQPYWSVDQMYEWSKCRGSKKSPGKSLAAEKSKECKPRNSSSKPRRIPKGRSVDSLLLEACEKLKVVKTDRYIMRQQAKIEGCKEGMNSKQLKHLEWFDYSKCPKKYTNVNF